MKGLLKPALGLAGQVAGRVAERVAGRVADTTIQRGLPAALVVASGVARIRAAVSLAGHDLAALIRGAGSIPAHD